MATILGIDPGPEQSAWVVYDPISPEPIIEFDKGPNELLLTMVRKRGDEFDHLAIEMIASYGMPVGKEVFDTCVWIGRFSEAWNICWGWLHRPVYRKDVKMHLCHSMRANDGNVAQALRDRLGPKGTKKAPGPCFGISKDVWQALAVAVTYADSLKPKAAV
jgi:hypothetical protein